MKILVACEESQAVTIELRKLGHEAYSCDIIPCSGGHPEWHIQQDVLPLLNGNCFFTTDGGSFSHSVYGSWDMIIAFPPCTYFSTAGANWLFRGGQVNQERYKKGLEMRSLFLAIYNSNCLKIAIENPVPMKIWELPPHTQEIQPWQFGHPVTKKTRLWIKGLPLLLPTDIVAPDAKWVSCGNSANRNAQNKAICKSSGSKKRRAETFPGVARAMAEQWAGKAEPVSGKENNGG